jgi:hypothetical protein
VNEYQESLISNSLIENEEFYDTVSQMTNANSLLLRRKSKRKSFNSRTGLLSKSSNMIKSKLVSPFVQVNYNEVNSLKPLYERIKPRQRRTRILKRPTDQSSLKMLKDLLKNASGKDLSKIPMLKSIPCSSSGAFGVLWCPWYKNVQSAFNKIMLNTVENVIFKITTLDKTIFAQ